MNDIIKKLKRMTGWDQDPAQKLKGVSETVVAKLQALGRGIHHWVGILATVLVIYLIIRLAIYFYRLYK